MKRQPPSLSDLKPLKQAPKLMAPPQLKTLIVSPQSKAQQQQIRQTPHFIFHQPVQDSPRKLQKAKNLASLNHQSVVSLKSFQIQENLPGTHNQQNQSPIINFPNRDTQNRPTLLNQYLSVTSFPDEFQYRPSKNSLKRLQDHSFEEEDNRIDKCQQCEYEGQMDKIYKLGWVAWSWIVFFILSSVILFFIPLVIKSFQEKELICPECGSKVKVQTPTCL